MDNIQLSPINGKRTIDNDQLFPSPIFNSESFNVNIGDKVENDKINTKFFPLKMSYCKGESSASTSQYLKLSSNSPIVDYYTGGNNNRQKGYNFSPEDNYRKSLDGYTNQYNQIFPQDQNQPQAIEGKESPLYQSPFDCQNQHFNMSPSRLFDTTGRKSFSPNADKCVPNINQPFFSKNLQEKIGMNSNNIAFTNQNYCSYIKKSTSNTSLKQMANIDNSEGKIDEEQELYMISFDSDNVKDTSKNFDDQDEDFNMLITQDNNQLPFFAGKGECNNNETKTTQVSFQQFPTCQPQTFNLNQNTNQNMGFNPFCMNQINTSSPQELIDYPTRMMKMQPQMSLKQGLIEKLQTQKVNDSKGAFASQSQTIYQQQYQSPTQFPYQQPTIQNQFQKKAPFKSQYQAQNNQLCFHQQSQLPFQPQSQMQYQPMQQYQSQAKPFQQNQIPQFLYRQDNSTQFQSMKQPTQYQQQLPPQQPVFKYQPQMPLSLSLPLQSQPLVPQPPQQQCNNQLSQKTKHQIPISQPSNNNLQIEPEIINQTKEEKPAKKKKKRKNKKKKKNSTASNETDGKVTQNNNKQIESGNGAGSNIISLTTNNYYSHYVNNYYVNNKDTPITINDTSNTQNANTQLSSSSTTVPEQKTSNSNVKAVTSSKHSSKKKKKKIKKIDPSFYINSPIEELAKNIYSLAKDQAGCRYLQIKLDDNSTKAVSEFFPALLPHLNDLSNDAFGNYFIQKLFFHLSPNQIDQILSIISTNIFDIGSDSHGTRVIQSLIDYLTTEYLIQRFVTILKPVTVQLINELNGTHVIQKFSDAFPDYSDFIYEDILNNALLIATHRHGCCVLQRYFIDREEPFCKKLISVLLNDCLGLAVDQFGNYIIQAIMKLSNIDVNNSIAKKMLNNLIHYSKHKYSSNIIEKCFDFCDTSIKQQLLQLLSIKETIDELLIDEHGNYIVQKVLACSDVDTQNELLNVRLNSLNILL